MNSHEEHEMHTTKDTKKPARLRRNQRARPRRVEPVSSSDTNAPATVCRKDRLWRVSVTKQTKPAKQAKQRNLRDLRVLRGLFFVAFVATSATAAAQQRPLTTEDPETVGAGRVLLEGGIDYGRDVLFPASGLTGNLLRAPAIGVSIGLSSIAELQIDGGFYHSLAVTDRRPAPLSDMLTFDGSSTSDVEDVVLATKIRILSEGSARPGLGIRLATKLGTASNESGLGLDTTDFYASILLAKTMQSIRVVANMGLGILGDPTRGDRQHDVVLYGLSFARALTNATEIVGEVNGRASVRDEAPPPGTESRSAIRVGGRYTRSLVRVDAGLIVGLTSRDPGLGFTAGATYVFNAFRVP